MNVVPTAEQVDTVLVFAPNRGFAQDYIDKELKDTFLKYHDKDVEFIPLEYIHGAEGRRLQKGMFLAFNINDYELDVERLQECISILRRSSIMSGLVLEAITLDMYIVLDPMDYAKKQEEHRKVVAEVAKKNGDVKLNEADENYIRLVYNTPNLHGTYCPCKGCETNMGPMANWIHEIGKKGLPEK